LNKYPLLSKVMVIGLLMILLSIPLMMVRDVIQERSLNREAATQEVARAHAGAQTITGPVLYVPYTETFTRTVPVGDAGHTREERVTQSTWPHPSFGGDFLPRTRTVSAQGFEAAWSVPSMSTQAQQQFVQQQGEQRRAPESFSVSLDDPVDVYRMTERATKYAMMFIVLTFAAFFVLEMVRRWRIHPMQYLMIGAALVLFFLLLLSISEHLDFVWAYLVASVACIGLLAHYLRHVLGGWTPGLLMSGLLVALYGVLYGILVSEDNALMMGSLLLFGVLAAIMVATRKVDWYSVMGAPAAQQPPVVGTQA
jgi:inner membrane protein involved in colicin E2 resistance